MLTVSLSWNGARLIALILNALYGIEHFYETHQNEIDIDGLFGLRVIQGQLKVLHSDMMNRGINKEIMAEMLNLSLNAGFIADEASHSIKNNVMEKFSSFESLLMKPFEVNHPPQRLDEQLRWSEKTLKSGKLDDQNSESFFGAQMGKCFEELLHSVDDAGENKGCALSDSCLHQMLVTRGQTGQNLTHQIMFLAVATQVSCAHFLSDYLMTMNNQTAENLIVEFCSNLLDELLVFKRKPRLLARLNQNGRGLLIEQVFACGQFGFVEISSLNLLAAILSWQHPSIGCISWIELDKNGNFHQQNNKNIELIDQQKEKCSMHSTSMACGALIVFMRYLLDTGPWKEFHLADQPVVVHGIAAEDRFRLLHYGSWIKDVQHLSSMRYPPPPHVGWSPDLLAYIMLLFLIIICSMLMQHFYKPRSKPMYYFAYKKL